MGGVDLLDANAHDKKWYWANCTNALNDLESAASKGFLHDIFCLMDKFWSSLAES